MLHALSIVVQVASLAAFIGYLFYELIYVPCNEANKSRPTEAWLFFKTALLLLGIIAGVGAGVVVLGVVVYLLFAPFAYGASL